MIIDKTKLKATIPIDAYYRGQLGNPEKTNRNHWIYFCPFHSDEKTPNLAIYFDGGFKCFACDAKGGDVLAFHQKREGLSFLETLTNLAKEYAPELIPNNGDGQPPRIVAEFDYQDEAGKVVYQVVRYEPKDFKQRRPDGNGGWNWGLDGTKRVPYRLPEILKAEGTVFIPGGEKDVNTLVSHRLQATTNSGGEGNWLPEFNEYLKDRDVIILEDHDDKGEKHGQVVSQNLHWVAKSVKIIRFPELPKHGDVSNYLENHTPDEFLKLVETAPAFKGDYLAYFNECPPAQPIPIPSKNGNRRIREIMADAGFDELTEDSEPEETITAINKCVAVTVNFDSTKLALVKSELRKKLDNINVKGVGKLVTDAFKVDAEKENDKDQGVTFEDPEPWPDEVSGAELLEEIEGILKMYTVLPEGANTVIALWILFAWAHDSFFISPYLVFSSPTKRCGKSTTLTTISKLAPRPLTASNISTAGFFRSIDCFHPTLILDELDTFLNNNQEISGIINAGHDRDGAFVLRVEGEAYEPKLFSVWGPKVFAGIGRRKDTLEDRSIIIPMKRKSPSKKLGKINRIRPSKFKTLRQKAARWSEDHAETLETLDPFVPESLNDRAQDNWQPLMAVAEIAGGAWPEKARKAALIFSGGSDQDDDSIQVQLLIDIDAIFKEQGVDQISSEDLTKELVEMEDRPWPEFKDGRPITKTGVALILKPFKVKPKTIRLETGKALKGYRRDWFDEVFEIYLANTPILTVTPVTTLQNKELDEFQTVTNNQNVTDGKSKNTIKNKPVTAVTVEKGGIGGIRENGPDIKESSTLFGAEEEI